MPNTLVEIWQANACGRYVHVVDQHPAPLDPNFTGAGRTVTDAEGYYQFITIKPGAYPWGNHPNAWRPAHIHLSLFGHSFLSRLVTQMYFPGDPLFPFDPIFNSVTDEKARAAHDLVVRSRQHGAGLGAGYRFDIVLRGRNADADGALSMSGITPSQTVGPFFAYGADARRRTTPGTTPFGNNLVTPDASRRAHPHRRPRLRRRRRADPRCDDRDLAGRRRGPLCASGRHARAAQHGVHAASAAAAPTRTAATPSSTIKPGAVPGPNGSRAGAAYSGRDLRARHARASAYTRIYFSDEAAQRRRSDPRAGAGRAPRHADRQREERDGKPVYRFDIRLQGDGETVFFEV